MKKLFSFVPFLIGFFTVCVSVPNTPPPAWVEDMQSVYPWETYLAEKGIGRTAAQAEIAASRAISSYISTQVNTLLREEARMISSGPTEITATEVTVVGSDLELLAMRYAVAWYNRLESQWETVAYINREEAWVLYEPGLRREKETFLNIYTSAETERDPIRRFAIYRGAQNYYAQHFGRQKAIASRISPVMAEDYFSDVNRAIAELPQKIDNTRQQAVIFVECINDYQNFITQAFERMLSNEGFRLTRNRREASGTFIIRINWNEISNAQETRTVYSFDPDLLVTLTGTSGVLFSYNAPKIQRVSVFTRDTGARRAATALTTEVENSFPDEFRRRLASFAGQ